jgi:hypothetical protein
MRKLIFIITKGLILTVISCQFQKPPKNDSISKLEKMVHIRLGKCQPTMTCTLPDLGTIEFLPLYLRVESEFQNSFRKEIYLMPIIDTTKFIAVPDAIKFAVSDMMAERSSEVTEVSAANNRIVKAFKNKNKSGFFIRTSNGNYVILTLNYIIPESRLDTIINSIDLQDQYYWAE